MVLATKVKGIRVNQLAKELDVPSKAILDKLKAEGLGDKVTNHMSLMPLGLAETVREWFVSTGGGGTATAVEAATEVAAEAEAVEAEAEEKTPHAHRKKAAEHQPAENAETEAKASETPVIAPVATPVETVATPVQEVGELRAKSAAEVTALPVEAKREPAAPAVMEKTAETQAAAVPVAETPVESKPVEAKVVGTAESKTEFKPAPAVGARGSVAPIAGRTAGHAGAKVDPRHAAKPGVHAPREHGAVGAAIPPRRSPVIQAPMHIPRPAAIRGPVVVRTEQPDVVPTPRRRLPLGGLAPSGTNFNQALAKGGRGVKPAGDEEVDETGEVKKKVGAKSARTLSSRRRDLDGRRGEADQKLREWSQADLDERKQRLAHPHDYRSEVEGGLKKQTERGQHGPAKSVIQRGEPVEIEEPVTVKSLSSALGLKTGDILGKLLKMGAMANINATLDKNIAETLALGWGVELHVRAKASLEEQVEREFAERPTDPAQLATRPPVVTILGHVDHGKTSLLDRIRKTNVAAGEAGGITQHIAAWQVQLGEKRVTFIDTPGHQAFTSMRARGAAITDVVVLVVSAAEGVQPQTIESINHAKAAGVPIVVAMNKIDRPDANPEMILGQLAKEGLNPVEWGGDVEVVRTSATTGVGISELIEILDYQSQLLDLKADVTSPARGTVIESRMDEGLGAVATVLVQDGTLRVGDIVLSGAGYGRVRILLNDRGEMIPEAGPSTPVIVSGLNLLPSSGDKFYVLEGMEQARLVAEEREISERKAQLGGQNRVTAQNLYATMKAGATKTINLIIKADVQGSVETLERAVLEHNTEEVKVKVIHAAAGGITESDVDLATATQDENSSTVIIGFHVVPEETARALAEQRHVEIRLYRVIYEILDDLKKALSGMLEPEVREKLHGHVEIRQVFKVSRVGNIGGCMVLDGHIQRGSKYRLIRDSKVITEDLMLESLKRVKDDVREVKAGFECGLKIAGYDDIKVGDRLEAYSRELIRRTL